MAIEIERRFRLKPEYLHIAIERAHRVSRITQQTAFNNKAFRIRREVVLIPLLQQDITFTICVKEGQGVTRLEHESVIAPKVWEALIPYFPWLRDKMRYMVMWAGREWAVDVHITPDVEDRTEIELSFPAEQFEMPPWAGEEM